MKKDLDTLMEAAGLDALLVSGSASHNPAMFYFTGNVHVGYGDLIKLRGEDPVLFCNPMEREEAARSGLKTRNLAEYHYSKLLKQTGGDPVQATALRYQKMFADLGLTKGRVSIYGSRTLPAAIEVFNALQKLLPEVEIVGEMKDPVLMLARETKDEDELEHTRKMGAVTVEIVGRTAKLLAEPQGQRRRAGQGRWGAADDWGCEAQDRSVGDRAGGGEPAWGDLCDRAGCRRAA